MATSTRDRAKGRGDGKCKRSRSATKRHCDQGSCYEPNETRAFCPSSFVCFLSFWRIISAGVNGWNVTGLRNRFRGGRSYCRDLVLGTKQRTTKTLEAVNKTGRARRESQLFGGGHRWWWRLNNHLSPLGKSWPSGPSQRKSVSVSSGSGTSPLQVNTMLAPIGRTRLPPSGRMTSLASSPIVTVNQRAKEVSHRSH